MGFIGKLEAEAALLPADPYLDGASIVRKFAPPAPAPYARSMREVNMAAAAAAAGAARTCFYLPGRNTRYTPSPTL